MTGIFDSAGRQHWCLRHLFESTVISTVRMQSIISFFFGCFLVLGLFVWVLKGTCLIMIAAPNRKKSQWRRIAVWFNTLAFTFSSRHPLIIYINFWPLKQYKQSLWASYGLHPLQIQQMLNSPFCAQKITYILQFLQILTFVFSSGSQGSKNEYKDKQKPFRLFKSFWNHPILYFFDNSF